MNDDDPDTHAGADVSVDLESLDPGSRYFLMTGVVVPRPIAWVSSLDRHGRRNLAPFSYFNICSATPPIVHFTCSSPKDSSANVLATEEFVVNVVSGELAEAMRISSAAFSAEQDEFEWAGLEAAPSVRVRPPRVAAAKVALECRLNRVLKIGEGTMMFGDVLHAHISSSVWRDGRVDPQKLRPVGRLSGVTYVTVEQTYRLEMPDWVEQAVGDYQVRGMSPTGARSEPHGEGSD